MDFKAKKGDCSGLNWVILLAFFAKNGCKRKLKKFAHLFELHFNWANYQLFIDLQVEADG